MQEPFMRKSATMIFGIGALGVLAGCAMAPVGPTVSVFPAPYKPFEVFQQDQYACGQYAGSQVAAIGGTIGADQSERAGFSLQRRYDIAYAECMYSRGNQVPGFQRSAAPPPP